MIDVRHLTDDEAQAHLEGFLPAAESTRIAGHLAGCAECQALVASFEALQDALSGLPVAEPPMDFTAGVMARIDAREEARAGERRVALGVLGAVLATLGVALVLAGQAAWAPALSAVSSAGVAALQAFRISSDVLAPVISALRVQIIVAAAAVGLPLLLALSRLSQPRSRQLA